jgi:hypothetical protein
VRRYLEALDNALECLATVFYGPQPLGYRLRPSLWAKRGVFGMLGTVVVLGLAARGCL